MQSYAMWLAGVFLFSHGLFRNQGALTVAGVAMMVSGIAGCVPS